MSQQSKKTQSGDAETETSAAAEQQKEVKDGQPPVRRQVKRYDIKKNPPRGANRP